MATAQASGPPPNVVPCMPGCIPLATRLVVRMRSQRQTGGQRFRHGDDVRLHPVMLIGEVLSGAAQAALDFVDDQQRAGAVASARRAVRRNSGLTGRIPPSP